MDQLSHPYMTTAKTIALTLQTFVGKVTSLLFNTMSSHVRMWELDYKESWVLKNWCFWTVLLEQTLESPLESKEIKPINLKRNQPWILIGRTDAEAEAPVFCSSDADNSLEKSLMLGKIEGRRRRGCQRMRWLDSITMQWTWTWANFQRWEGQGGLVCYTTWGCKDSETTGWLNYNENNVEEKNPEL